MRSEKQNYHNLNIIDILDKESEATCEIYLYNEGEQWVAYEHSAISINKIYKGLVFLKNHFNEAYELMLNRTEIDFELATTECSVLYCSDSELVLSYDKGL